MGCVMPATDQVSIDCPIKDLQHPVITLKNSHSVLVQMLESAPLTVAKKINNTTNHTTTTTTTTIITATKRKASNVDNCDNLSPLISHPKVKCNPLECNQIMCDDVNDVIDDDNDINNDDDNNDDDVVLIMPLINVPSINDSDINCNDNLTTKPWTKKTRLLQCNTELSGNGSGGDDSGTEPGSSAASSSSSSDTEQSAVNSPEANCTCSSDSGCDDEDDDDHDDDDINDNNVHDNIHDNDIHIDDHDTDNSTQSDPDRINELCRKFMENFKENNVRIIVVIKLPSIKFHLSLPPLYPYFFGFCKNSTRKLWHRTIN